MEMPLCSNGVGKSTTSWTSFWEVHIEFLNFIYVWKPTAVNSSQRTVFSDHKLYPSMELMINGDSTVTHLWNPIIARNPEDGDDAFSETSVRTRAKRHEVPEGSYPRRQCP
jgi:hypothetical protein